MKTAHAFVGAAVAIACACGAAQAGNQLTNPGFDTPSGLGPTSGTGFLGYSAAAAWGVWNNSPATTDTALGISSDPSGGGYAVMVSTGAALA